MSPLVRLIPLLAVLAAFLAVPAQSLGVTCPSGQFSADYYANTLVSGTPVLSRCETKIENTWGSGGPGSGVPTDNFSVRWVGNFDFSAGEYEFIATVDDGIRVFVDGVEVLESWIDQPATMYKGKRTLSAGAHEVKVEYYEHVGHATALLSWQKTSGGCAPGQFTASYFNNRTVTGSAALTRCESEIDNSWGYGGPASGVTTDNFSARWVGTFGFEAGEFEFTATVDDGIRVFVDDVEVIESWINQPATTYKSKRVLTAGNHEVKVEYYEKEGGATASVSWAKTGGGTGSSDSTAPSTPSGLSVSNVSRTGFTLSWSASSDTVGVTGYDVYRGTTKVGSTTTTRSYAFTGLTCGTTYTLGVEARDAANNVSSRATTTGQTAACSSSPPPSGGAASLFISTNGSDSGPCSQQVPCASFQRAYQLAQPGVVVEVAGGTYPSQSLNPVSGKGAPNIVFRPAGGQRVLLGGISVDGASYITFRDFEMTYATPDHQRGVDAGQGSSFITFERIDAGNVSTWLASNITVLGGDYGPCRAPANGCWLNNIDVSNNVVIDGAVFHDYNYLSACLQSGDCHWRAMFVNGVNGFTLRNSTFRNSVFAPWTSISGSEAGARGNSNILIENNQFGKPVQSPMSAGWQFAWCQNGSQPSYRNVTFRFNSFARGTEMNVPGWYDAEFGCRVANVRVYGNIFGVKTPCPANSVGVQWSHNVYAGPTGGICGIGDVNIGGTGMPFYEVDTTAPSPGNFSLTGSTFAGDNHVPASLGCPATDAAGNTRGAGGFCDAGAFER